MMFRWVLFFVLPASVCFGEAGGDKVHAQPVPAESGYAHIDDISRFPLKTESGYKAYWAYLKAPAPKAFALSRTGIWVYDVGEPLAMENVLKKCKKYSAVSRCDLYAVDDKVVYPMLEDMHGNISVRMMDQDEDTWSKKVREQWLPKVQQMTEAFATKAKSIFGVTFTDNVEIYVTSSGYDYQNVLKNKMKFPAARVDALAWDSAGVSNGIGQIAMVFHSSYSGEGAHVRAMRITAHELVHELQAQMAGTGISKVPHWFQEGTAEVFSNRLLAELKFETEDVSEAAWKEDITKWQRWSSHAATPDEIFQAKNSLGWQKMVDGKKGPYEVAALMILHLQKLLGDKFDHAWVKFVQLTAADNSKESNAFQVCFGISQKDFEQSYLRWVAEK